jgi:pyruvate,water dikinase
MNVYSNVDNTEIKSVFSSAELTAPDPKQVGNKAANLWWLAKVGLQVPPWFVIPCETFSSLIGHYHIDIKELIEKSGEANVQEAFAEQLLSQGREMLTSLIQDQLNTCFNTISLFSVRSSAVDEDSKHASFAGIMESYLFVHREHLVDKVVRCAASAFSEKALAYRRAHRIPFLPLRVAVIVQEMIDSEKSGVVFTRDPVSNTYQYVITAGFGVGEGAVSNRVETDTFWLDPATGEVVMSQIGTKKTKMSMAANSHAGAVVTPIKAFKTPVLNAEEIRSLFEAIKRIELNFAQPQDIEWAFDTSGTIHLIQTRPITSLPDNSAESVVWDNSNIVESYPGVTTPLTYSFARYVYENVMKRTAIGLTLNRKAIEENSAIFETLIGYIDGRIYYNLTNWYSMVSLNPTFAKDKTACNRMLGIKKKLAVTTHSVSASYRSYAALLWKFVLRGYYRRRFYRAFDKLYAEYADVDFDSCSLSELYATFKKLEASYIRIWPVTIENDLFLMFFYDLMNRLVKKMSSPDSSHSHPSYLFSDSNKMESLKPVESILNICNMIHRNPNLTTLFSLDDKKVLQGLRENPDFKEVHAAIFNHIKKYGDRTLHELKLETKSMRDDPAILIRLIRHTLSCERTQFSEDNKCQNGGDGGANIPLTIGKRPFKYLISCRLRNLIRESITHRENMRFARTRAYGLVKRIFGAIGLHFCQLSLLDRRDDIFFLAVDEIFSIINGSALNFDLKHTVRSRRKRFLLQKQSPTPPSRLFTRGVAAIARRYAYDALETNTAEQGKNLKGIGCCPGQVSGRARIVRNPDPDLSIDGEILVAEMTDPGWVFLMMRAGGMIVERGSILSHSAIIGREMNIPTIVGVKDATKLITDGSRITLDGTTGEIQWQ